MTTSYRKMKLRVSFSKGWDVISSPGFFGWRWKGSRASRRVTGHVFFFGVLVKVRNWNSNRKGAKSAWLTGWDCFFNKKYRWLEGVIRLHFCYSIFVLKSSYLYVELIQIWYTNIDALEAVIIGRCVFSYWKRKQFHCNVVRLPKATEIINFTLLLRLACQNGVGNVITRNSPPLGV